MNRPAWRLSLRIVVSFLSFCILAACAPYKTDPNAESVSYDNRIRTGSNIPRKGSAVVVDKAVLEEQMNRQGGTIQR
jgi:hypothetical protein